MITLNYQRYNNTEKNLLISYSAKMSILRNASLVESEKLVSEMLDYAIKKAKKEKSYYLPDNFSDMVIKEIKSKNLFIKRFLNIARKDIDEKKLEGVSNEDIRLWWNKSDVERKMIIIFDQVIRLALNQSEKRKKGSSEIANEVIWKTFPIFSEDYKKNKIIDYRPLPYELKERVDIYIEKIGLKIIETIVNKSKDSHLYSSVNSFIRSEIKKGNI